MVTGGARAMRGGVGGKRGGGGGGEEEGHFQGNTTEQRACTGECSVEGGAILWEHHCALACGA